MRNPVAEDDPPRPPSPLSPPGVRHVDRFVDGETNAIAAPQDCHRADRGVVAENAIVPAGGIVAVAQSEKKSGAEHDPQRVEQPQSPAHAGYDSGRMTRTEIEQKLIELVRKEKDVPGENLSSDTPLADVGIDSLDALTILFAIEEDFHISIPDDKARAIKTFGDMVTVVQELLPSPP